MVENKDLNVFVFNANTYVLCRISAVLVCMCAQSCLTLCNPMDYSPPGSSVHGIFLAKTLEWITISYFRGTSQPRDQSCISCIDK